MKRIAILVGAKGRGSNMANLIEHCHSGRLNASVAVIVSPQVETPAVAAAEAKGIPVRILDAKAPDYPDALLDALRVADVSLVCLAGLMTKLPNCVIHAFPSRVLNIHPALLPKFGGKGMYGIHVHEAVLAAKEAESGCTVHLVSEEYDEGEILIQYRCPVLPEDTPADLATRVLECEHRAYPAAIAQILSRL